MRLNSGPAVAVAGAIAAIIPPILVLGASQPAWLGILVALVFFAVYLLAANALSPRPGRSGRLDVGEMAEQRRGTAADLLREGEAALDRLRAAPRFIHDQLMREEIRLLTMKADRVLREVRHDPDKVMAVRRMLTFYLPNAASVAEGWRALEGKSEPAPDRVQQTRETMAGLNDAFTQFADDLHEPQMQTLDLDLKVLNEALKQDLEHVRR